MIKKILSRLLRGKYYSLNRLDRKLEKYVNFDNGYYVELGANDGVTQSNSLYFEKHRHWRGLLVEPVPHNYIKCLRSRGKNNAVYCAACVPFNFKHEYVRIVYSNLMSTSLGLESDIKDPRSHVEEGRKFLKNGETVFEFGAIARTLNSLLLDANAPNMIDFLSLDVEGAEIDVLKGVDHDTFRFRYILVECRDIQRLTEYLNLYGYRFVDSLSSQDYLFESVEDLEQKGNS